MLKYIVFAGLFLIHQSTACMVAVDCHALKPSITSSTVTTSQATSSSSTGILPQGETILPQKLITALEQGNQEEVIALFSSRWNWLDSWQNYYTRVEHSLEYAARHSEKKTGAIVSFLLSEVKKKKLELPESLLTNAKKNGHTQLVEYLIKTTAQRPLCPRVSAFPAEQCLPHEAPRYTPHGDIHGYIVMGVLLIPNLILGTLLKCIPTDDKSRTAE